MNPESEFKFWVGVVVAVIAMIGLIYWGIKVSHNDFDKDCVNNGGRVVELGSDHYCYDLPYGGNQ